MTFIWWLRSLTVIILASLVVATNSLAPNVFEAALRKTNSHQETLRDDTSKVLRRELSTDILATSIPVVVTHNERINPQIEKKGLMLRSSSHNISGIQGFSLFALPILASDLADILHVAQVDLQSQSATGFTSFYHVNTTKWSFSVIAANTSIPYATIRDVVQRYLKLSTSVQSSNDITTTRVGVLFNASAAVADINISPCRVVKNGTFLPFAGFGLRQPLSKSKPVEIVRMTPFESTCDYELLNETTALAPFENNEIKEKLSGRQLESEILAHIGHSAFAMTVKLWRREDGLPVEVKIWALKAIIYAAYWQFIVGTLFSGLEFGLTGDETLSRALFFDAGLGLDTGLYVIGRLVARFVVKVIQTASDPQYGVFSFDTWTQIFGVFLKPLQEMGEYDNGWAMDGVIYGPNDGAKNSSQNTGYDGNVVATWQIWMGDFDELDY